MITHVPHLQVYVISYYSAEGKAVHWYIAERWIGPFIIGLVIITILIMSKLFVN